MQVPLQLTFRGMAHSELLSAHLRRRVDRLEQIFDRIVSCHVVVEPTRHHHRAVCEVSIHLGLPGHEILVGHRPAREEGEVEPVEVTADTAFDDAERQIEDWVNRQHGLRHHPARSNAERHRPGEAS